MINTDFIADIHEKALSKLKMDNKAGEGMLLTSDHPERSPGVNGVEIYFPINPQFCIVLVDWQKGFKNLKIDQINKQIALEANKYIYSYQADFSLIRKFFKNHPEKKIKTGKRSIIKRILKEKRRRF